MGGGVWERGKNFRISKQQTVSPPCALRPWGNGFFGFCVRGFAPLQKMEGLEERFFYSSSLVGQAGGGMKRGGILYVALFIPTDR